MDRGIKEVIKRLEKAGWTVEQGRKHYKAYPPQGGGVLVMSASPSDVRAYKNIERDIRRIQGQGKP